MSVDVAMAGRVVEGLRGRRPIGRGALRDYVKVFFGVDVGDASLCEGHCSPMDYLWHAWSCDGAENCSSGDAVVWANRGGGKTHLAAVATLLDCLFKPGCSVRILGGSREQSSRMYEYLGGFVHGGYEGYLDGAFRKEKCRFVNGATVEVMSQSARNVRGRHINKLRCDEVELFDEKVFDAAKFITHSTADIVAAMETASTMHRPWGLMSKVIENASEAGVPVFKWCMFEVIEKCADRHCGRCALSEDCRGRAKRAGGYLKIDDCISQMRRSSRSGFEAEMLCLRPSMDNAVFGDFDEGVHVGGVEYDETLPLYRAIDFGFVNPFVCLWVQVDGDGVVRVIDEYVRRRATIEVHGEAILARTPCGEERVAGTFCDPAGSARGDVTGTSAVNELGAMGIGVVYCRSRILEGVELIRRAIRAGDGARRFVVNRRCVRLIEALKCYHYPDAGKRAAGSELPVKDGVYDHAIDALRYFFVNYDCGVDGKRRS